MVTYPRTRSVRRPEQKRLERKRSERGHSEPTLPAGNRTSLSVYAIISALLLIGCYWGIDHEWDRSVYYAGMDEALYNGNENETADRINQVNAVSTVSRLLLGAWGLFCLYQTHNLRYRWSSPLLWSVAAISTMLLMSVFWSSIPKHTIFKLVVLVTVAVTSLGFAAKLPLKEFLTVVTVVCVAFIGIGVFAELVQGTFRPGGSYRFIGTAHPNTQAVYGAMLCLIARLYFTGIGKSNYWGLAVLACGILVILMTKSRTTLAGVVVGLAVTQFLIARGTARLFFVASIIGLIGMGFVASSVVRHQTLEQFMDIAAMGRSEDVSSLTGRLPLWEELLSWVQKSPIVGYGYLSFWDAKRVEYLSETFRWEIPHGHNMYIDTMLDIGLVGLVLLISCIVCALTVAALRLKETKEPVYAILFGIFVCATVNGFAESLFKLPGFPLFVVMTCCFSLIMRKNAPSAEATYAAMRPKRREPKLPRHPRRAPLPGPQA